MHSLRYGRTLTVEPDGKDERVDIRAASGVLELRVQLTEDGVVLQLEGARISLRAAESVDVECRTFTLNAAADVHLKASGDMHVEGQVIHLN